MKRTIERLLFMLIGALIAFFSYLVGNIDRGADAQDQNLQKIPTYETLHVKQEIFVGNVATGGVFITASDKKGTGIHITYGNIYEDPDSSLLLGVSKEAAVIELKDSGGTQTSRTKYIQCDSLIANDLLVVGSKTGNHIIMDSGPNAGIQINSGLFENPDSHIHMGVTKSRVFMGLGVGEIKEPGSSLIVFSSGDTLPDKNIASMALRDDFGMNTILTNTK